MPPSPSPRTPELLTTLVGSWCHALHQLSEEGGLGTILAGWSVLSSAVWASDNPGTPPPCPGFDPKEALQQLLSADTHLKATCITPWALARAIEHVTSTDVIRAAALLGPTRDTIESVTRLLISGLFEDDYKRRVFFRLYNVELTGPPPSIAPFDGVLEILTDTEIPRLTGEVTATSTLHRAHTGNVFLVFEDQQYENDIAWWQGLWDKANVLLRVLMYLKYEVVSIDYSVIHFSPEWVNRIRRYGITVWGQPRADAQKTRYTVSGDEQRTLVRYLAAIQRFQPLLEDQSPTLRKATATAGDYYESHHSRTTPSEQLIALSIALEAMFSPSNHQELAYRISHRAALLLGEGMTERREIARFLQRAYSARSRLVHGSQSPFQNGKFTSDELRRLADLVREAILRLSVLYARGQKHRETVMQGIEDSAYDPVALENFRKSSDVDAFLTESGL